MKIVFFGNSKYSVIGAKKIQRRFPLSLIVTNPNSRVDEFGKANNIPVVTALKINDKVIEKIKETEPDFLIVEDYGLILPKKLLEIPKKAPLNVHHSLLPKYRGPTPAPSAILSGEQISGVSVIKMTEKVDAGDILTQEKYKMKPDETTDSLLKTLNLLGGKLAVKVIKDIVKQKANPKKQNEQEATYTRYMKKSDGFIDFLNPPNKQKLDLMIRAYYPWPGVWTRTELNGKKVIVKFLPENKIQVEGKKPMSYKDFLNGYPEGRKLLEKLKIEI